MDEKYQRILDRLRQGKPDSWITQLDIALGNLDQYGFKDAKSFITGTVSSGGLGIPLDKAKELMYFNPVYEHIADELSVKIGLVEVAKKVDKLTEHGTNQHSGGDKTENVTSSERGNANSYRIAKLKRDHPEIAQGVIDGKYKSVSEAERAAGIGKPLLTPVEKIIRAYSRLSDDDKRKVIEGIIT